MDLTEGIVIASLTFAGSAVAAAVKAMTTVRRVEASTKTLPARIAQGDGNGNAGTNAVLDEVRGAREEARQTRAEVGALHRDLTGLAERQDECRRHGDSRYTALRLDVETLKSHHWGAAQDVGGR